VKLIPRSSQVIGRVVIKRRVSTIVRPDETRETTKFVLIDALGPSVAAKGFKVGDVVLPTAMANIKFDGGVSFRPIVHEDNIAALLADVTLDELAVQTESGSEYVPLDSPKAALSIAESSEEAVAAGLLRGGVRAVDGAQEASS
jgi:hypothetical protein